MTGLLFRITLHVEAEGTEPNIREKVEWALNGACSKLEGYLPKHEGISYRIKEVLEI